MKNTLILSLSLHVTASLFTFSLAALTHPHEDFVQCISSQLHNNSSILDDGLISYTPNDPSYLSVLNFSINNARFASPFVPKPIVIVTPRTASQVQATVYCARKHGFDIRTRSGGHDFEGLSYVSYYNSLYVVLDLIDMRSISVDVDAKTALVEAGATLGELYYAISQKSRNLGFPAGLCHSPGVGGFFSGGGHGMLTRKYGLSADNVIDVALVDVDGRILDRESMGEDLFWAVRGGGAAGFGIVIQWTVRLVYVPSIVTVPNITLDIDRSDWLKIVHRWQYVADKFNGNLTLEVSIRTVNVSTPQGNNRTILQASFADSLFLGRADTLVSVVRKSFPELGLTREHCVEMSWIRSVLVMAGFRSGQPEEALLGRNKPQLPGADLPSKGKSDYVKAPIPEKALEMLFDRLYEREPGSASYNFFPYGAIMSEIPEDAIPFPHRRGNIYEIFYLVHWSKEENNNGEFQEYLNWIRSVYSYMTPYVSKHPREAYLNYRDLDIGTNNVVGNTSYEQASIYGKKYFKNNFKRLVHVKTRVDPTNFFRNEQTVSPLPTQYWNRDGH